MTPAEQTTIARECARIVMSRLPEDEQEQQAILIGSGFGLDVEDSIFQLNMARVYLDFDLQLQELHDDES